jgi:hypothetical protein
MTRLSPSLRRILLAAAAVLVLLLIKGFLHRNPAKVSLTLPSGPAVENLAANRESGIMVEAAGSVRRILADDNEGSRHQRFIVELPSGHTVLVAHNIDLAPRVPVEKGDQVKVYGQYQWNELGGVLHWTHHDPAGRHEEGWIEHLGQRYQ